MPNEAESVCDQQNRKGETQAAPRAGHDPTRVWVCAGTKGFPGQPHWPLGRSAHLQMGQSLKGCPPTRQAQTLHGPSPALSHHPWETRRAAGQRGPHLAPTTGSRASLEAA